MSKKYHIPINPNDQCFLPVGEIVVRWSWLENQVVVILRELLRITGPQAHISVLDIPVSAKLRVIQALAKHHFKINITLRAEVLKFCNDAENYRSFRNDVAHGLWVHRTPQNNEPALLMRDNFDQRVDPHPDFGTFSTLPNRIKELKKIQTLAQKITDSIKALNGKFE